MGRATISTGGIPFRVKGRSQSGEPPGHERSDADSLQVLVIGDFSGKSPAERTPLETRACMTIDRDNFDEAIGRFDVRLELAFWNETLHFEELDDFEPEVMLAKQPIFTELRTLRRRLKDPASFDDAAREIAGWAVGPSTEGEGSAPESATAATGIEDERAPDSQSYGLDDVLGATNTALAETSQEEQQASALLRSIVRPHIVRSDNPKLAELLLTLDESTNELLRQVMLDPGFRELEANWRSLRELVMRTETGQDAALYLCDITKDEIAQDYAESESFEETRLFRNLVQARAASGRAPLDLLLACYRLEEDEVSAMVALTLASTAETVGAACLTGGHEKLARCPSLLDFPEPAEWPEQDALPSYWADIRSLPAARHLSLLCPRVLLRPPYGPNGLETDVPGYAELADPCAIQDCAWGVAVLLVAVGIVESMCENGRSSGMGTPFECTDLPTYVYPGEHEQEMTPCAEVYMTDSLSRVLVDAGLTPLRSIRGRDAIIVPMISSFHEDGAVLAGA